MRAEAEHTKSQAAPACPACAAYPAEREASCKAAASLEVDVVSESHVGVPTRCCGEEGNPVLGATQATADDDHATRGAGEDVTPQQPRNLETPHVTRSSGTPGTLVATHEETPHAQCSSNFPEPWPTAHPRHNNAADAVAPNKLPRIKHASSVMPAAQHAARGLRPACMARGRSVSGASARSAAAPGGAAGRSHMHAGAGRAMDVCIGSQHRGSQRTACAALPGRSEEIDEAWRSETGGSSTQEAQSTPHACGTGQLSQGPLAGLLEVRVSTGQTSALADTVKHVVDSIVLRFQHRVPAARLLQTLQSVLGEAEGQPKRAPCGRAESAQREAADSRSAAEVGGDSGGAGAAPGVLHMHRAQRAQQELAAEVRQAILAICSVIQREVRMLPRPVRCHCSAPAIVALASLRCLCAGAAQRPSPRSACGMHCAGACGRGRCFAVSLRVLSPIT